MDKAVIKTWFRWIEDIKPIDIPQNAPKTTSIESIEAVENIKSINRIKLKLPLTAGYSITMVSIKLFITVSMMIGNIIDIYLSGIMIVLINWLMYSGYFGLILCSYLLYLFLTRMELFLIISFMLESFSIISQSLTISNRLSINIKII